MILQKQATQAKGLVVAGWRVLRKPTTPVHIAYGLVCAFLMWQFGIVFAALLMIGFALWEMWNDRELLRRNEIYARFGMQPLYDERNRQQGQQWFYVPEGAMDFWESTLGFIIGAVVLAVLQNQGIISIVWW